MKNALIALVALLVACAPAPKVVDQGADATLTQMNWMAPGIRVERAYCARTIGDCYQAMSQKCGALGYMAQSLGDHDTVFRCRPREVTVDVGTGE